MSVSMAPDRDDGWIKAAASAQGGNCVQMRRESRGIEVRDSKYPDGPVLRFTDAEFAAWVDGAKRAEFDHLLHD
jgi:Domain of unknown function (DUF397)